VIIEENKSTDPIVGNPRAVNINHILNNYNQLSTYYSTGNPSEPNYTALGGGDDFGIHDDNWFGCGAVAPYDIKDVAFAGGTASDGQPLPAQGDRPPTNTRAGWSGTAGATCSDTPTGGTVHNVPGDNLFTLMSRTGRTIRTYSESMNPGQDVRGDSIADAGVTATYDTSRLKGVTNLDGSAIPTLVGTPNFAVVNGLYKVKHGPSIAFQSARNLPEFAATNRTIFGTQYQEADWLKTTAYKVPSGWVYDQFSKDLAAGDVGNINFIVPDQCDDMHGVGSDTTPGFGEPGGNGARCRLCWPTRWRRRSGCFADLSSPGLQESSGVGHSTPIWGYSFELLPVLGEGATQRQQRNRSKCRFPIRTGYISAISPLPPRLLGAVQRTE